MNPLVAASVDMLQRVPLFAGLSRKELEPVAASMRERSFKAGETVVEEGTTGAGFFVIVDGNALVTVGGKIRRTLHPGDHFGEIALLTDSERTATITATTDLSCYGLTSWELKPLVEANPTLAWELLQSIAQRLA